MSWEDLPSLFLAIGHSPLYFTNHNIKLSQVYKYPTTLFLGKDFVLDLNAAAVSVLTWPFLSMCKCLESHFVAFHIEKTLML